MQRTAEIRRAITYLFLVSLALPVMAQNENHILLRVNDRIATLYDFKKAAALRIQAINSDPAVPSERREELLQETPRRVLSEMLDQLLITSRADQLGVTVTDFEVDELIAQMRQQNGLEEDERFQMALAQSGMTVDELREQYRSDQARYAIVSREVRSPHHPQRRGAPRHLP